MTSKKINFLLFYKVKDSFMRRMGLSYQRELYVCIANNLGMANIITGFRVLISIALLFCPVFSPVFYTLYLIAGVSDMIDGTIARRTNTVSGFGARFDTAADFVFVVVCMIKLLPVINMQIWLCVWIVIIALIKTVNIISGYIVQKKLVAVHSVMNKVTGVLLFILPLTLSIIPLTYSAIPICAVATFAAVQEGYFIRRLSSGG